ncbi:MAG: acyltransferase [Methylacidiphilales bacterium]|nr:acyltransferase [Candidatus Methylacidiphilales bacterium]
MKDRLLLAIKGVAIFGVAVHHIANRRFDPQANHWLGFLSFSFDWCVLAFFCVSGYLHALSDQKRKKPATDFIIKRARRLLAPFVLLVIFYACIWQLLEILKIPDIATKVPSGFFDKIITSLWPVYHPVAEQLYFLPMLFGASVLFILIQRALGLYGVATLAAGTFLTGLILFPGAFTGFTLGVFIWGLCFYAGGYLLYQFRDQKKRVEIVVLVVSLALIVATGAAGVVHAVPLLLICYGSWLALDRSSLLINTGEASGTIYIYHTPFLIQPLVIIASHFHSAPLQVLGGIVAALISIALCYALHFSLKGTKAEVILI